MTNHELKLQRSMYTKECGCSCWCSMAVLVDIKTVKLQRSMYAQDCGCSCWCSMAVLVDIKIVKLQRSMYHTHRNVVAVVGVLWLSWLTLRLSKGPRTHRNVVAVVGGLWLFLL